MRSVAVVLGAVLAAGCGIESFDEEPAVGVEQEELASRHASAAGFGIWLDRDVMPVETDTGTSWVLHGHVTADLTRAFAFVCDDALGGATLTGPRTFDVTFDTRDFEVALSARDLYLALDTADGRSFYATYTVLPRLTSFSGSNKIWVEAKLALQTTETSVGFVGELSTSVDAEAVRVTDDIDMEPEVLQVGPRSWEFAWPSIGRMLSHPMTGAPIYFRADLASGTTLSKQAKIVVSVPSLRLSTQEPY